MDGNDKAGTLVVFLIIIGIAAWDLFVKLITFTLIAFGSLLLFGGIAVILSLLFLDGSEADSDIRICIIVAMVILAVICLLWWL